MNRVKPKKFLGQHFLKDLDIARRIADTVDDFVGVSVVEVGPGMGVLTQFLIQKDHPLKVVELDRDSIPYLHQHYPQLGDNVIEGDFLQLDLTQLFDDKIYVIGNYPYNISSQIFFKVLEHKDQVVGCSGMLQREVAERIASKPGSKAYGILSVLLQAWYDIEYLFTVSEKVFDPPPKVKSAVIKMSRNNRQTLSCDEKLFKTVVKTGFNQRRKTLRNSLQSLLGKNNSIYADPIFAKRPEQLSVAQFEELTNLVEQYR